MGSCWTLSNIIMSWFCIILLDVLFLLYSYLTHFSSQNIKKTRYQVWFCFIRKQTKTINPKKKIKKYAAISQLSIYFTSAPSPFFNFLRFVFKPNGIWEYLTARMSLATDVLSNLTLQSFAYSCTCNARKHC